MHEFKYKGKEFFCEQVSVNALAAKYGTPLYVYSYHTLIDHFQKLKEAFKQLNPLICFSVKSNSNLALLKSLVHQGAGLDIVSGGELYRVKRVKCPGNKVVYASVGKTEQEIEEALKYGILFFNVESLPELRMINSVSKRLGKIAQVAIRLNPDVEAKTHKYITTGKITNKFGIDFKTATGIFLRQNEFHSVKINGIHIHIGSQITESAPFVAAIKKVIAYATELKNSGVKLEYLNIGGGLGVIYNQEAPQTALEFARHVVPLLKESGFKIILEPGRFIVGQSGILVSKVLYVKETPKKNFLIIDAGMNDLIRPALYEAYHEIVPLRKNVTKKIVADVVGPICESGDTFARDRLVPHVAAGDYIALMTAGAYGFSMSSNYNSRRRVGEVLVIGDQDFLIRKREEYRDLIRNEVIPSIVSRK